MTTTLTLNHVAMSSLSSAPSQVLHILEHVQHSSPVLLTSRPNLVRRQQESKLSAIPQLPSIAQFSLRNVVDVVQATAIDSVQSLTSRTSGENLSVHRRDDISRGTAERYETIVVGRESAAGVSPRREDEVPE